MRPIMDRALQHTTRTNHRREGVGSAFFSGAAVQPFTFAGFIFAFTLQIGVRSPSVGLAANGSCSSVTELMNICIICINICAVK